MRHFLLIANMDVFGRNPFNKSKSICNICNSRPPFWLPRGHTYPVLNTLQMVGAGFRWVDCPFCFSSDRDRLVFHALNAICEEAESWKVLHVAPEKPIWKRWKNWGIEVTGIDLRTKGYRFTYSKKVLQADLTQSPFDNNTFNLLVANHVLEHIPDEEKALKEIHRVLKPGGLAILQVPFSTNRTSKRVNPKYFDARDRIAWVGQADHVRLYGMNPWNNWLHHGFEFVPFEVSLDLRQRHNMNPKEPLILLKKI